MVLITDKVDPNKAWMIRPIQLKEAVQAKRMIYRVAHQLMEPQMTLEEVTALWDSWGAFCDLDDIPRNYGADGGVFLVIVAAPADSPERIIGTGSFHRYAEGVCELRRITLLPEYRGRGLGYALLMELIRRARAMSYRKIVLWTNRFKLTRAVDFYHQLGFIDMPLEGTDEEELWMDMEIIPQGLALSISAGA